MTTLYRLSSITQYLVYATASLNPIMYALAFKQVSVKQYCLCQ